MLIGLASSAFAAGFYLMLGLVSKHASLVVTGSVLEESLIRLSDYSYALISSGFDLLVLSMNSLLIPVVAVAGAAASSFIVYKLAPEAEGHGTDAVIASYHRRGGHIRVRVPFVKAVASALTIGTGGSGGIEGPGALMGAGIGSAIAGAVKAGIMDRKVAALAGAAAALSALFQAPVGAALFVVEVLYKRDVEVRALVPAIMSSIVGYSLSLHLFGHLEVMRRVQLSYTDVYSAEAIAAFLLVPIFMAPFAVLYIFFFYRLGGMLKARFGLLAGPIVGAAITGILGIFVPYILGSGRTTISTLIDGSVPTMSGASGQGTVVLVLVIIALLKMVATAASIGSGGSGGVFAPGIFVGALLGYAYGIVASSVVGVDLDPIVFAYVGMAAFFAAASKTPLATSFLVAEISGSYALLPILFFTTLIARELTLDYTIYGSQEQHRINPEMYTAEALLYRIRDAGVKIKVSDVVGKSLPVVRWNEPASTLARTLYQSQERVAVVVGEDGTVLGVIDLALAGIDVDHLAEIKDYAVSVAAYSFPKVRPEDPLERALSAMIVNDTDYVVVVDENGRYVGAITLRDVAELLPSKLTRREEGKVGSSSGSA